MTEWNLWIGASRSKRLMSALGPTADILWRSNLKTPAADEAFSRPLNALDEFATHPLI
jgi:hypothetical protein